MHQSHSPISVTASHQRYICPEGASVQMVCHQSGALHKADTLRQVWLYNSHSDQHCLGHLGPRNLSYGSHNHTLPRGVRFGHAEQIFWVVLENLTRADQGRYCCAVGLRHSEHNHDSIVRFHSYSLLQVTSRKDGECLGGTLQTNRLSLILAFCCLFKQRFHGCVKIMSF